MDESKHENLEDRVARLEEKIESLNQQIQVLSSGDSFVVNTERPEAENISPPNERSGQKKNTAAFEFGENWLNRIGIGLLLLGVIFLFKYSIDQNWLIPPIRSLIGLGIGLTLFVSGLQLGIKNNPLKQLLLGGGIATFYITGFATFQLYSFVSPPIVWGFMIVVTLLALSLSLQQNESILSVVGILGGIGTPFMLFTGSGNLWGLIAYTSLVLSGGGIIYFYKGWRSLLWTMALGGWSVLIVGFYTNVFDLFEPSTSDLWSLQTGVIVYLLLLWVMPVFRRFRISHNQKSLKTDPHVNVMALILPIISLVYSMGLWELTDEAWGVMAMAGSLMVGYLYLPLKNEDLKKLASTHGFTALILLTISFFLLLQGDLLFIILALEALGLGIVAYSTGDQQIGISSHILFGITLYWLLDNFSDLTTYNLAIFNLSSLTNLLIIAIGGLAAPYWLKEKRLRMTYRSIAHLALLGWFLSEFAHLENGQAYVSLSWGIYAISILVLGFIKNLSWLRLAGMATIFLVVGKLFLVDLSQLQAIWRILLFIGFGSVLLLISYIVQQKFSSNNDTLDSSD